MDNQNPLKKPLTTAAPNPLAQYYRRPGTYITLPSRGRFYAEPPTLSDTGELAIYPMTAKDELILKNPDALLNGEALKQVLASVAPDIPNVNEIPSPDIDTILVAMRMASYGDDMELDVNHNCKESEGRSQRITAGLGSILATMKEIAEDIGTVVLTSGVTVKLRPYTLENQSRLLRSQFNTMRHLQAVDANPNATMEDKSKVANQGYDALIVLSQDILVDSILTVILPDGTEVSNKSHIADWIKNLDRSSADRLDIELKRFGEFGITRNLEVPCEFCKEKYTTDMLFDPTSFFGAGS
jgi:hypothetical protein